MRLVLNFNKESCSVIPSLGRLAQSTVIFEHLVCLIRTFFVIIFWFGKFR